MHVLVGAAGYLALALTPLALLAHALVSPADLSVGAAGLTGGALLTGAVSVAGERDPVLAFDGPTLDREAATDAGAVVVAAVVTYGLSVHAGLGPVLASAVVGLLAGVGARSVDAAAYCGTFVGMASPTLFPSAEYVALAGLVAGLAFVAAAPAFDGFGGKLGTLALFGCASTAALTGADYGAASALAPRTAALVVPVAAVGAVAAAVFAVRLDLGAVVGSALVGVAAGVALPPVAPAGGTLAAAAYCASFVGMSSRDRLATDRRVAAAGALCGAVFVAAAAGFPGAGGKLGTVAFTACVAVAGAEELLARRP